MLGTHDTPITLHVRKSEKVEILKKMMFKMGLEYFDNLQFFDLKLFSNASRNFSADFTNMFKLLERSA